VMSPGAAWLFSLVVASVAEPFDQVRVSWFITRKAKIIGGTDQTRAKMGHPQSIHKDSRC
jgi:hypothetical protein